MIDKQEVEAMISAQVAPLHKQVQIQRRRTSRLEKRVTRVEKDVATAMTGFELVERVFSEGMGRIELKMDKQHNDLVRRLDQAEGFILRRRRIEKSIVRLSELAVVGTMRRWLPFVALFGVVLIVWAMLVSVM
jgi:hypothetical protein